MTETDRDLLIDVAVQLEDIILGEIVPKGVDAISLLNGLESVAKAKGISREEYALQLAQSGFLEPAASLVDSMMVHPAKIGEVLKIGLTVNSELNRDDNALKVKNTALVSKIDSILGRLPKT